MRVWSQADSFEEYVAQPATVRIVFDSIHAEQARRLQDIDIRYGEVGSKSISEMTVREVRDRYWLAVQDVFCYLPYTSRTRLRWRIVEWKVREYRMKKPQAFQTVRVAKKSEVVEALARHGLTIEQFLEATLYYERLAPEYDAEMRLRLFAQH